MSAEGGDVVAGDNSRADDACHIGTHGVHEQEVGAVGLLSDGVGDACSHGNGGNAGRADKRVDGVLAPAGDEVHELGAKETANGSDGEGNHAQSDDEQGFSLEEAAALHRETDGDAEQDGCDIHELILGAGDESLRNLAFAQEIAEHEHAEQRRRIRTDEDGDDRDHEAEEEFLTARDLAQALHLDLTLLLRGEELHEGRLDERHERHVGVGGNGDGAEEVGRQFAGEEDGGRTVSSADDADRRGLSLGEAQGHGREEREGDATLGGRAEQQRSWRGEKGTKIGERADTHEDQCRENFALDALSEEVEESGVEADDHELLRGLSGHLHRAFHGLALGVHERFDLHGFRHSGFVFGFFFRGEGGSILHGGRGILVGRDRPGDETDILDDAGLDGILVRDGDDLALSLGDDHAVIRDIGDERAEGDGDEQEGLELHDHAEKEQHENHAPHDVHLVRHGKDAHPGYKIAE